MGYKSRVDKRKSQYSEAVKKSKADAELSRQFRKLNSTITQRKRKSPLDKNELMSLDGVYRETIKKLSDRMDDMSKKIDAHEHAQKVYEEIEPYLKDYTKIYEFDDDDPEERKKKEKIKEEVDNWDETKKDLENIKGIQEKYSYYSKLMKAMSKDLKTIDICIKNEQYPSVTQLYENSRSYRIERDLSKTEKVMGNANSRIKIGFSEDDGVLKSNKDPDLKGFFTVSRRPETEDAWFKKIKDENIKKYGDNSFFKIAGDNKVKKLADFLTDYSQDIFSDMVAIPEKYMSMAYSENKRREVLSAFMKNIEIARISKYIDADEKKQLSQTLQLIQKPQNFLSFIDYMSENAKRTNSLGALKEVGVSASAKADKRSSAMSTVADMLGMKGLVADSRNLQIKDTSTGKIFSGTFMENADGADLMNLSDDNMKKFNQLSPNKIENSLSLKKNLADIQILDWLCGNPDRHERNLIYKFDKDNNIIGVIGIDNDLCFGKADHSDCLNGFGIENFTVITKETAEKVASLDKEAFKLMLYGYDINTAEVNKALSRLTKLQNKIKEDAEYFKDMPKGYVEAGRIRIVDDEELGSMSMYADLAAGEVLPNEKDIMQANSSKNLFKQTAEFGENAAAIKFNMDTLKESVIVDNGRFVKEICEMGRNAERMAYSEKKTWGGHQPFRDMLENIRRIGDEVAELNKPLSYRDKASFKIELKDIENMKRRLNEAKKTCTDYMGTKNEAEIMRKSKKSNAYIRYNLAKETKEGIDKAIEYLDNMVSKAGKIKEYNQSMKQHKNKCKNELDEINKNSLPKKEQLQNEAFNIRMEKMSKDPVNKLRKPHV